MEILYSHNLGGNVHAAVAWVNKFDLAERVIQIVPVDSCATIIVLRMNLRDYVYYVYDRKRLSSRTNLDDLARKHGLLAFDMRQGHYIV
jgi:hypothetical protein